MVSWMGLDIIDADPLGLYISEGSIVCSAFRGCTIIWSTLGGRAACRRKRVGRGGQTDDIEQGLQPGDVDHSAKPQNAHARNLMRNPQIQKGFA